MSETRAAKVRARRSTAPQWVTHGGLETELIHHHGVDLPGLAAYPLLRTTQGRALLGDYYAGYAEVARRADAKLLLETPTWRANPDWVVALGGSPDDVRRINLESVVFLAGLGDRLVTSGRLPMGTGTGAGTRTGSTAGAGRRPGGLPFEVRGVIGPRRDGHTPGAPATAEEFAAYHSAQVAAFAESGVGWVTAYTLTTLAEAVGVVLAARAHRLRVGISFTVETDGRLPDGTRLGAAVESLWQRSAPDGLLVNCAHPSHIAQALPGNGGWARRVTGLRVNASRQSHAELDASERLDKGNLRDLVREHQRLATRLPNLDVVGGCCGTDVRHVAALWGVSG